MATIRFDSGELVDGTVKGWPASFIATRFPGQGWDLHVAPYSGADDQQSPDDVLTACREASDADCATKADVRAALNRIGFSAGRA